jgi:hypothetical protein
MVKVQGSSYRKVDLPELDDCVRYGQIKIFSDSDYESSPSLKKALDNGRLTLLENREGSSVSSKKPTSLNIEVKKPVAVVAPPPEEEVKVSEEKVQPPEESSEYKDLLKKIEYLQNQLNTKKEEKTSDTIDLEKTMAVAMEKVVEKMQQNNTTAPSFSGQMGPEGSAVVSAIEKLSEKIEGLSASGPGVVSVAPLGSKVQRPTNTGTKEEIYIPDIVVKDVTNNVTLDSKNIGQGGGVNEALNALRKLKDQNRDNK